ERVGDAVVHVEERADVHGVLDRVVTQPDGAQRLDVGGGNGERIEGQLLEEPERGPQRLADWGGAPVGEPRVDRLLVSQRLRRDRAVSARSKRALVQTR